MIENLIEGKHNLTLYGYDYDGNRITSNVTFYVEYDEKNEQINSTTTVTYDSTIDLLAINYYFPMISIIFINFLRKISTKWMIG